MTAKLSNTSEIFFNYAAGTAATRATQSYKNHLNFKFERISNFPLFTFSICISFGLFNHFSFQFH